MTIQIKSNEKEFNFRLADDRELIWICENYATDNLNNGSENHRLIITNFDDGYQEMMNATTHLMYQLNLDKYRTVETFIKAFGHDIKECGLLYKTMQKCVGGTQDQIDVHMRYMTANKALKKENRILKIKITTLELKLKKAHKKNRKR